MNEVIEGLIKAVNSGRTDIVRSVIATCETEEIEGLNLEILLNSPLTEDGTILHVASKENQVDIVRTLLMAGADPCIQNKDQKTPLDIAENGDVQSVFNNQLLQCIAQSDVGHLCQLIAAGVNVNLKDSPTYQNTPLHWAACYGNREVVQCLCDRGASVTAINSEGATPIHDAVLRGQLDVIEELLRKGGTAVIYTKAYPGKKYEGKSPIELASEKPEVMKLLQGTVETQMANGIHNMSFQNDQLEKMSDGDSASVVPIVPTDLNNSSATELPNGATVILTPTSQPQSPLSPDTPGLPSADAKMAGDAFPALALKLSSQNQNSSADECEEDKLKYLWPKPQKVIQKEGKNFKASGGTLLIFLHSGAHPEITHKVIKTWKSHEDDFKALSLTLHLEVMTGEQTVLSPHLISEVNENLFSGRESYRMAVHHSQIKLQASDTRGLHYAIATLLQLFRLFKDDGVPNLQISDHPSIRDRGIILDMSKGRIPQLECMKNLVKTLALLKINQVHIYHRFCIPNDPMVKWQFPYSRSIMLELAEYCESLGIELIPVLDLTPRVTIEDLDILYSSFQSFLTCFISASYIGIGPRLTSFLVDITDEGELNLEDTERFLPVQSHQTLQLCAFVFHDIPHMLAQYPCNMTLAEYGFQASYDFDLHGRTFQENGIPFFHVPGTAAWNSLAGCPEAAVQNIYNAVHAVKSSDGLGVLVSHWSGVSHMTHMPMIWSGVVAGAGLSWNTNIELEFLHSNLAQLINRHILQDSAGIAGQVIVELGRAETYLLRCARNQAGSDNSNLPAEKGSTLYQLLTHPDQVDIEHLNIDMFQKTMRHIRKCQSELSRASLQCTDGSVIISELQITADLMLTACRVGRQLVNVGKNPNDMAGCAVVNLGVSNLSPTMKTDLANRLLSQIETYRTVWLSRNLPQGLQDSMLILSTMLKQFVPEEGINE